MFAPDYLRTQKGKPSAAVDRTTGNIYVVYTALDSNGSPRIFFAKSTNTGTSWSTPVIITDNPVNSPVFNPAIAVSADGTNVTVCFYDMRNDPNANQFADLYLAQSLDGGTTWRQPNTRVSTVSTDITLAPNTEGGYMLGDYIGIAEATSTGPAVPIWIDTRNGNPDPYIAQVGIGGLPALSGMTVVTVPNGDVAAPFTNGFLYDLRDSWSVRADPSSGVSSVTFKLDGTLIRTENSIPYTVNGDNNGAYNQWAPTAGNHTLVATPYTKAGATGTAFAWELQLLGQKTGAGA